MRRLEKLLAELGKFGLREELIQPGLPELGSDLAMPCFSLAKELKADPAQIAEDLAQKLKHPELERVQAVNGYLNLWLSSTALAEALADWQTESGDLGCLPAGGKRVIVEYFSPNLAKPISAGHLRNLFQGRALANLHRARGFEVITDNHIGDWGTTFGQWVVGLLRYGDEERLQKKGLKEMGRVYAAVSQALKAEKAAGKTALQDEIQAWVLKLERGDEEAWRYHRFFSRISREEIDRILKDLEIEFDEHLGESFYSDQFADILADLEEKGVAERQADRSLIVDLNAQGIKVPLLIQKSNGATLYATSDIATLAYRQQRWQPDKVVYVVGMEQQLHFKQLFAFNRIARFTTAELIHHSYGLIEECDEEGRRHKMSSRSGAAEMEDVLARATDTAGKLTDKRLTAEDVKRIAHGALVFQDFSQGKKHNILFDWERIFSLSEMSGSYVQYATLRLRSILNKAGNRPEAKPIADYDWRSEHQLLIRVLAFEDVLEVALKDLEPSKIAFYVFGLCQELNRYYEKERVLDSAEGIRDCRLWLLAVIHDHLVFTLAILGIKMPSRM